MKTLLLLLAFVAFHASANTIDNLVGEYTSLTEENCDVKVLQTAKSLVIEMKQIQRVIDKEDLQQSLDEGKLDITLSANIESVTLNFSKHNKLERVSFNHSKFFIPNTSKTIANNLATKSEYKKLRSNGMKNCEQLIVNSGSEYTSEHKVACSKVVTHVLHIGMSPANAKYLINSVFEWQGVTRMKEITPDELTDVFRAK